MTSLRVLLFTVFFVAMSPAYSSDQGFEGCWGLRKDGFPSADVTFKVTKIGGSEKFKVIIYNQGTYFSSVTAEKVFLEGATVGDSRGFCAIQAYVPQDEAFPFTVSVSLHHKTFEDICSTEEFEIVSGTEPSGYNPTNSLQLMIHQNRQLMISLHTYEPVRTNCPEN